MVLRQLEAMACTDQPNKRNQEHGSSTAARKVVLTSVLMILTIAGAT